MNSRTARTGCFALDFAVALVIVAIILKSYLLVVFIVLAAESNIYALKVPETFDFELTREQIKSGAKPRSAKL